MRAALVKNTVVENVILVSDTYAPPAGYTLVNLPDDSPVSSGDTHLPDGTFVKPTPPLPNVDDVRLAELRAKAETGNLTTNEAVETVKLALKRGRI